MIIEKKIHILINEDDDGNFSDPYHNHQNRTNQSSFEALEYYTKTGKCERDRQNIIHYLLLASPEEPLTMRDLKRLCDIDDIGTVSARISEIREMPEYQMEHTKVKIDGRNVGAWYLKEKNDRKS